MHRRRDGLRALCGEALQNAAAELVWNGQIGALVGIEREQPVQLFLRQQLLCAQTREHATHQARRQLGLGQRRQQDLQRFFGFEQRAAFGTGREVTVPAELAELDTFSRNVTRALERTLEQTSERAAFGVHDNSPCRNGARLTRKVSRARWIRDLTAFSLDPSTVAMSA